MSGINGAEMVNFEGILHNFCSDLGFRPSGSRSASFIYNFKIKYPCMATSLDFHIY